MSDDGTVEIEIVGDDDVDTYELDADSTAEIDVDSVIEDALEAVTRTPGEDSASADLDAESAQRIAELQASLADANERAMRSLADLENFRKRAIRERQEERRGVSLEILREVLPIVDNLERALQAGGAAEDLKMGVELILKEVETFFTRRGVERVAAVGEAFDPTVHEAVSRHEDPTVTQARVSEEFQPGYVLGDRLLRPAIVKVVMPAESSESADKAGS